jgi:hypothetical protein
MRLPCKSFAISTFAKQLAAVHYRRKGFGIDLAGEVHLPVGASPINRDRVPPTHFLEGCSMSGNGSQSPREASTLAPWRFMRHLCQRRVCYVSGTIVVIAICLTSSLQAQVDETPQTRLRPIGSPSAVDSYLMESTPGEFESHHIARMQYQLPDAFEPPGDATQNPFSAAPIAPADSTLVPPPTLGTTAPPVSGPILAPAPPGFPGTTTVPRSLPLAPTMAPTTALPFGTVSGVPGGADSSPIAAPQLADQFATIDNCACISPPSGYVAATGWPQPAPRTTTVSNAGSSTYLGSTAPVGNTSTFIASPTTIVPAAPVATVAPLPSPASPTVIPNASSMPKGSGVPKHSLVNLGQDRNPVVLGQGIIGQPVAYVPGQPIRNWFRYIFP